MNSNFDIIIVGGGAAGFFTAINIVEKKIVCSLIKLKRIKTLDKKPVNGGIPAKEKKIIKSDIDQTILDLKNEDKSISITGLIKI